MRAPQLDRLIPAAAALTLALTAVPSCLAQKAPSTAPAVPEPAPPVMPVAPGQELDRIIAIVNGDVILDSDVNEEERFEALQPYRDGEPFTRDKAIERLINRDLILQQDKLAPEPPITAVDVAKEIATLRKTIPACKEYDCDTDAGWANYLASHGFTPQTLEQRWKVRMEVLRFIEERFRMGIRITSAEIKDYYTKTMLPEYTKRGVAAPPLAGISDRIQEVLLQQQVSNLLGDWLKSLRAQGSVVLLKSGEVAP